LGILEHIRNKVPVIAHPEALSLKFVVKKRLKKAGITFQVSELEKSSGILTLKREPTSIVPGVLVSGEIERDSPFEEVKGFKTMKEGKLVDDYMPDDQGQGACNHYWLCSRWIDQYGQAGAEDDGF
jgi:metal-dependent hydrolase (beta-lactamase superfamily II)